MHFSIKSCSILSFKTIFLVVFFIQSTIVYAQDFPDFRDMVHKASPAVVKVITLKQDQKAQLEQGLGVGTLLSAQGYLLTNYHVIEGVDRIIIQLNDYREFPAMVIGYDTGTDLALLKIKADNLNLSYFNLEKTNISSKPTLEVGQWVVAIGSPFGFDHTVTTGVVSALGRTFSNEQYVPFIQSDVAINPGNSGGPLLNLQGDLVGINSQIVSETGSYAGLSFSIPISVVKNVYGHLKEHGVVKRGWLGLVFQDLDRGLAASFDLNMVKGALVAKVLPNSPAQKAGLKVGDIILKFNHQPIVNAKDIVPIMGLLAINSTVPVQVLRKGQLAQLNLILSQGPDHRKTASQKTLSVDVVGHITQTPVGIKIRNINESDKIRMKSIFQTFDGVVVEEIQGDAWINAKLRPQDFIISINDIPVRTSAEFYQVLDSLPKAHPFRILVGNQTEIQHYLSVLLP